jgi:hypothetical protein
MSPEQVGGDTLDRRTDLFSLGVVLYECVTGQQPFKGKTSAVVLASILTQAPTAPVALNSEVPIRLQEVITNCLEKDRELRYQDAAGLRADLKRIKRDLESGALKTASILSSGSVSVPVRSGTAPVMTSSPDTNRSKAEEALTPPRDRRGAMIAAGVAVVAVLGVAGVMMMRRGSTPEQATASAVAPASPPSVPAPPLAAPPAATDQTRARFDEAIVEANRLLAAGDTDGATRALNTARSIDPGAPVVTELSSRLVEQFRVQAGARRTPDDNARAQPPRQPPVPRVPVKPDVTSQARSGAASQAKPDTATQGRADTTTEPKPEAAHQVAPPAVVGAPAPTPAPAPPRPAATEPAASQPVAQRPEPAVERRAPATPAPSAEDDDAAIRRVVATYARAIEGKDLALFRSVKPNMSSDEQRRIEEGFRAVSSQRVSVTILGIDQRGQEASVRLRRRDVIQAGGRQQTVDSQQTMTLTKAAAGWVIREIGR